MADDSLGALPDFAFRRVLLKGRFIGPPLLQGPQTREGIAGYHLILPFDRSAEGGSTILVNQGFILTAEGDAIRSGEKPVPGLGPNGAPGEETVIEGMITKVDGSSKSYFVPDNQPENNHWYWKDIPEMAAWVGGEEKGVQPVLVDVIDRTFNSHVMLTFRWRDLSCNAHAQGSTSRTTAVNRASKPTHDLCYHLVCFSYVISSRSGSRCASLRRSCLASSSPKGGSRSFQHATEPSMIDNRVL